MVIRAFRERGGEGGRRAKVNYIPAGGDSDNSSHNNDEYFNHRFCPRDGRKLVFRDDLENWFCPECAYTAPSPSPTTLSAESSSTDPLAEKESLTDGGNDPNVFCYPVGKSRSEEIANRARRLPGEDDDLKKMLKNISGTIVSSSEVQPAGDADTFSSGDYTNHKSGLRRRYH